MCSRSCHPFVRPGPAEGIAESKTFSTAAADHAREKSEGVLGESSTRALTHIAARVTILILAIDPTRRHNQSLLNALSAASQSFSQSFIQSASQSVSESVSQSLSAILTGPVA